MRLIYNFFIKLFYLGLKLGSKFNEKAAEWVNGRKNQFQKISDTLSKDEPLIWFHCSSLGEFEQGRPVMQAVRENFSDQKILLTFFSPSGYQVRKNTPDADYVFYLPLDTQKNAQRFIEITRPRVAFFVKYEYWFNYINELSKNKIPTFVVSAIFRRGQYFFKPWGKWPVRHLQKITHFYVQDQTSLKLLNKVKVFHADIGGDTRFDRVIKLADEKLDVPEIVSFSKAYPLLVAGSTWPADEDLLCDFLKSNDKYRIVLAPHEVKPERIQYLTKRFQEYNPILLSSFEKSVSSDSRVVIVDSMGKLSYLYRYARIGYVGGGFGVGIHNVLEVATYGVPVIFGSNYKSFREANELIENGGGFSVSDSGELIQTISYLDNDSLLYQSSSESALSYVRENSGATQLVIDKVKNYLVAD